MRGSATVCVIIVSLFCQAHSVIGTPWSRGTVSFQCEHTIKWNYTLAHAWIIWGSLWEPSHKSGVTMPNHKLLTPHRRWYVDINLSTVVKRIIMRKFVDTWPFSRTKISRRTPKAWQKLLFRGAYGNLCHWVRRRTKIWVFVLEIIHILESIQNEPRSKKKYKKRFDEGNFISRKPFDFII